MSVSREPHRSKEPQANSRSREMMKTPRLKAGLLKDESSCLVLSSFGTVSVLLSEMRLESSLDADQMADTAAAVNGR